MTEKIPDLADDQKGLEDAPWEKPKNTMPGIPNKQDTRDPKEREPMPERDGRPYRDGYGTSS